MAEPYEPSDALTILRNILANDGDLYFRHHSDKRAVERNWDDADVVKVLEENGVIQNEAVFDEKHQKWKYLVDGYDTENEKLRVVVNISEPDWKVVTISLVPDWKEKQK